MESVPETILNSRAYSTMDLGKVTSNKLDSVRGGVNAVSDFNRMTVAKLKSLCDEANVKPPTGLNKAKLVDFVTNLAYSVGAGLPLAPPTENQTIGELTDYEGVYMKLEEGQTWRDHIMEKGWATVPVPDFNSEETVNSLFSWLESLKIDGRPTGFRRDDRSTWVNTNLPMNYHGIFKNYIGHEEFIWNTREKCISIFQQIWMDGNGNPLKLLCSFDGACFLPQKERGRNKSWIHCDQSRYHGNNLSCIQGLVNLQENGPDDGGLLLLEGSQHHFEGYLNRHLLEGFSAHFKLDMGDPGLSSCRPIKICAPAGHILLWESRIAHCNVPPRKTGGLRMCIYVSMQPDVACSDKDRKRRIKTYEQGRMTGHWCYGEGFTIAAEHPRTYGNSFPMPKLITRGVTTDPKRRELIGYAD